MNLEEALRIVKESQELGAIEAVNEAIKLVLKDNPSYGKGLYELRRTK